MNRDASSSPGQSSAAEDNTEHDSTLGLLMSPVPRESSCVGDADLFLRKDGLIVAADGWSHPPEYVCGEPLYAPTSANAATHVFFSVPYRKLTVDGSNGLPIPYERRREMMLRLGLGGDIADSGEFCRHRFIYRLRDFYGYFPTMDGPRSLARTFPCEYANLRVHIERAARTLNLPRTSEIGHTGSTLLGRLTGFHDIDVVFRARVSENLAVAKRIRDLVSTDPSRRVTESGKGWRIRYFDEAANLICCFFAYSDRSEVPFERVVRGKGHSFAVSIQGTVADDRHSIYTPSILWVEVRTSTYPDVIAPGSACVVAVMHAGARGDAWVGDAVEATGIPASFVAASGASTLGLAIQSRHGLRLMTPPWHPYYSVGPVGT